MIPFDIENNKNMQQNPFRVPANYFEDFKKNLMNQLPQEKTEIVSSSAKRYKKAIVFLRPLLCAAAVFCGVVIGIKTYNTHYTHSNTIVENKAIQENEEMVEDFCEYSRIRQSEIYAYVTNISE